jgi:hypothetical protein
MDLLNLGTRHPERDRYERLSAVEQESDEKSKRSWSFAENANY